MKEFSQINKKFETFKNLYIWVISYTVGLFVRFVILAHRFWLCTLF